MFRIIREDSGDLNQIGRVHHQKQVILIVFRTGKLAGVMTVAGNAIKVADVQHTCGFNTPQAIFKWMRGDAMPSIDNLVILSHMLGVTIDQIIIIN